MSVPKKETFEQIFNKHYDNDNKLCTRRSLLEQFKEINREWFQQEENFYSLPQFELFKQKPKDTIKELREDLE